MFFISKLYVASCELPIISEFIGLNSEEINVELTNEIVISITSIKQTGNLLFIVN